ncbi:MAG: CTP synthase [Candidatus Zambryskibacteria bacterium RIFCSPHIGHO2_01_FULL_49_18]|uniref:CTP synthase (glutamine hydrolyzing) n=2 Tax=Candidatus Zambryskiibacteriota TaxID=1817925 RepID=A0A1G2T1Y0_9BACT|nr:MAG: CTP synthase [Candidatus Zambryskibacteria bacterium RIFCSPHIGHO2_01_FULL_49_18]OHB06167.1 MAG: CTP synthase [Candidatus Zambryskibacteria bacterium RIFCSPLOWO2_01_FULL_47_14]
MKSRKRHKFIFVVGGVMSGVGKGVATSSIGTILQSKGFKISLMKADPYLNVDAGTMNPVEHGEVFVLDSGLETDQDMGNYERFLNRDLDNADYMTSGMVYKSVIDKERALKYGGRFVDADHIREEIVERIEGGARLSKSDITVVEIGGTIGDYQNVMFIEAARVIKRRHPYDVLFILVSYLPVPGSIGEMKSKPTQNAVKQLNAHGVQADMIIARGPHPIDQKRKDKIAFTCNIEPENVISAPDINSIYDVPINFERDGLSEKILKHFGLRPRHKDLVEWRKFISKAKSAKKKLDIAVVGKYFDTGDFVLSDAYVSVIEAVKFSSYWQGTKPKLEWINAKEYETGKRKVNELKNFDGVIVPGGFGSNGVEGIISAIKFVRENKIPYLGLCYGMQLAVIEYARNVAKLKRAHTMEVDTNTPHPVVGIMNEQKDKLARADYGGSMRLGSYPAVLRKGTLASKAYGSEKINERHRHRYEINPEYVDKLSVAGLVFSGVSPDGRLCEIAELPANVHPFFVATQFHPEFKARPLSPHPLFSAFIKIVLKKKS